MNGRIEGQERRPGEKARREGQERAKLEYWEKSKDRVLRRVKRVCGQ